MSSRKNVHVVPSGGKWAAKTEGGGKPMSTHRTQAIASEAGRRVARQNQS